jgi:hypothetical protein
MKQLIKISQVKSNPNNPRLIKNDKFKKLVKSIQEFPEMLELRPIVVDENMIVLGGNMRLKACIEAGLKEVWIEVADLTEQQKKEFTIKDNVGFGEWEWDMLANEWQSDLLGDWGLDVWQPEEEVDYSALEDLDLDETIEDKEAGVKRAIMIEFDTKHYDQANELITQARKDGKNVGLIVLNAFKDL